MKYNQQNIKFIVIKWTQNMMSFDGKNKNGK